MFSNFLQNLNKTCITEGVIVQPLYSIWFGAVTLIYSRVAACDSCVAEEITSTQLMDRDIGQLQQHLTPGPPLLPVLLLAPQGRVNQAQDNTVELGRRQRAAPLTVQHARHLHHGAPSSWYVIVDLGQESPPRPHGCQLLIKQKDVVVLVQLQPSQQDLSTEKEERDLSPSVSPTTQEEEFK